MCLTIILCQKILHPKLHGFAKAVSNKLTKFCSTRVSNCEDIDIFDILEFNLIFYNSFWLGVSSQNEI